MPLRNGVLIYEGSSCLRQRLVLSVLSGKSTKITKIRLQDKEPGIQEFEVNLIRLLDKITNGTVIELNQAGTSLYFQPGILHGGTVEHDCSKTRSIGYYLEALIMLSLFCKVPLKATLRGITSTHIDPSVDYVKASMLPVVRKFIVDDEGLDIKIVKRGLLPLGGGEVIFRCPLCKMLRPVQLLDGGMVKRIRGTAYALRVSPAMSNRMVETAKGVMLNFLPDIYIHTDQRKGPQSGKSPGFGIHIVAETTNGTFYSAEQVSNVVANNEEHSVPEDLGTAVAQRLLHEIFLGGVADTSSQGLIVLFMALGQKDVSKAVLGPLTEYTISFLRHLREYFGVTFKLENYVSEEGDTSSSGSNKVLLTCVGIGYSNISKRVL